MSKQLLPFILLFFSINSLAQGSFVKEIEHYSISLNYIHSKMFTQEKTLNPGIGLSIGQATERAYLKFFTEFYTSTNFTQIDYIEGLGSIQNEVFSLSFNERKLHLGFIFNSYLFGNTDDLSAFYSIFGIGYGVAHRTTNKLPYDTALYFHEDYKEGEVIIKMITTTIGAGFEYYIKPIYLFAETKLNIPLLPIELEKLEEERIKLFFNINLGIRLPISEFFE
jgi:hypothetical protein